jgi:hypothetical protein
MKGERLIDQATYSKDYDIKSIMHYSSFEYADPEKWKKDPTNPLLYPLAARKSKDSEELELLTTPEFFDDLVITDSDAQAIKLLYP